MGASVVVPHCTCKDCHMGHNPEAPQRSSDIELEIVQNCLIQVQSLVTED